MHASEISKLIHVPQLQYLLYWKLCLHTHSESEDCYWQFIYLMEIRSLVKNKTVFLPCCRCGSTTIWMDHLDDIIMKREKAEWMLCVVLKAALQKQQLCRNWPPISQTSQIRRSRYPRYHWRNRNELITDIQRHIDAQGMADQQRLTCISFMGTLDAV